MHSAQRVLTLSQKESGKRSLAKNVTKKVTEASEKVTRRVQKKKCYVAFVLLEAPKTPENSSRSKVGPEVGFGGSLKVGQK